MTNLDKAISVLDGQGAYCGQCSREPGDSLNNCRDCAAVLKGYAQALAEAGLLKTEFEESELSRLYGMETVVERGIRKGWLNECEFEDYL